MVYVADDFITKQQQILRVGYDHDHVFSLFSVKCIVADISFSNAYSGDQEKI